MVRKLITIAMLVAITTALTIAMAYASARAVMAADTQRRCASMSWAHSVVTVDLKRYCYTVYMGSETMAPLLVIEGEVRKLKQSGSDGNG